MDILNIVRSRRSIKKYRSTEIPQDYIDKLVEAARWAPSNGNRQPWKFIVITEKEILKDIASVTVSSKFIINAPLAIAIVINPAESHRYLEDGSAAIQNILLEAHSLGLGACWIGLINASSEDPAKKVLNIPAEERLQAIVAIGYPDESPEKTRKPTEEIVYFNKYGNKQIASQL